MPILIPGIGAQGGDIEATVKAGKNGKGEGIIISASRSVLYASSDAYFADTSRAEAQKLDTEIRKAL
jgi:orotidine-5'-phosphate decarboxylase